MSATDKMILLLHEIKLSNRDAEIVKLRDELAEARRERDERPAICRGTADLMVTPVSELTMIDMEIRDAGYAALRAHAAGSGKGGDDA